MNVTKGTDTQGLHLTSQPANSSERTQHYINAITAKTKPKKILVCMIYYPDESNAPSWANGALGALGYNNNPVKVQLLIRKFFEEATWWVCSWFVVVYESLKLWFIRNSSCWSEELSFWLNSRIKVPASEVIPIPLFHPLDGTNSSDYVARVEPSATGGRKMAEFLLDAIHNNNGEFRPTVSAPTTSFIDGRSS